MEAADDFCARTVRSLASLTAYRVALYAHTHRRLTHLDTGLSLVGELVLGSHHRPSIDMSPFNSAPSMVPNCSTVDGRRGSLIGCHTAAPHQT